METIEKYLMYLRKSRADSDNETVEDVLARHEKILQEFDSCPRWNSYNKDC